jgi:predicted GTPase
MDDLSAAIRQAVIDCRPLMLWLINELDGLARGLRSRPPAPDAGESTAAQLRADAFAITAAGADRLAALAQAQRTALDHFTMAFFGRTGAGKSSVIEALVPRRGETISDGRLDNTEDIEPVEWGSCRLLDTPGINGWGRAEDTDVLERRAEQAVRQADVVVVCFDSRGQQVSEFEKVAEWVVRYHKPLVVLFNVRSRLWGMPELVPRAAIREGLAAKVDQQVEHIRAGLAAMGLGETPIIAIHAQRAVAARATDQYRADDAPTVRWLHRFDRARLWQWSNLHTLERLLTAALLDDALAIRVGRLTKESRVTLADTITGLRESVVDVAAEHAAQIAAAVQDFLRMLGPPVRFSRLDRALHDLARHHRVDLDTSFRGTLKEEAATAIGAAMSPLRAEASARAETTIQRAIADGVHLSESDFAAAVFRYPDMTRARDETMVALRDKLSRRAGRVTKTLKADIEFNLRRIRANGRKGRDLDATGLVVSVLGIAAGAVAFVLGPIGAALWLIGGAVTKWFGGRLTNWGKRRREQETVVARANALKAVADTFDQLENAMKDKFATWCKEYLDGPATVLAANALELHAIAERTRREAADIGERLNALTDRPAPAQVVERAWRRLGPDAGTARSWVHDQPGPRPEPAASPTRPVPAKPARRPRWFGASRTVRSGPEPGSAQGWLRDVEQELGGYWELRDGLRALWEQSAESMPRIVICGDYNAGKSSLLRRLFLEKRLGMPDIAVGDAPTTQVSRAYAWMGVLLVDTPGFQSGHPEHVDQARSAIAGSAAAVYLFTSAGVIGDRSDLAAVLRGDPDRETAPLTERALFAIGRCDDLADPVASLDRYRKVVRRKVVEVSTALRRMTRGFPPVRPHQIIGLAADPDGLTSLDVRPEDLAQNRKWDGVGPFLGMLDEVCLRVAHNGVDIGVLRGGIALLAGWRHEREHEAEILARRVDELDALIEGAEHFAGAARTLRDDWAGRLAQTLRHLTVTLATGAVEQGDSDAQMRMAHRLRRIETDPEMRNLVREWQRGYAAATERLMADADRALRQRVQRTAFRAAFDEGPATDTLGRSVSRGRRQRRPDTSPLKVLYRQERDAAAIGTSVTIGTQVLLKVTERTAVRSAGRLAARAGSGGLAGVGVFLELRELWLGRQRSEADESAFREMLVQLGSTMEEHARWVAGQDESTRRAEALAEWLDELRAEVAQARTTEDQAHKQTTEMIAIARRHRAHARRLLGVPDETEQA